MCMSFLTARRQRSMFMQCASGLHPSAGGSRHCARWAVPRPRQPLTSAKPGKERSPEAAAQSASDPTRSMS